MRKKVGLILGFLLLAGTMLGTLAGCIADHEHEYDNRKTLNNTLRHGGPGSKH
jgi:hypothetical protein